MSQDLRIRVIRVIEGGMSRTAAAKRFGVSAASAVRWMQTYLRTGRSRAKPCGGDRRSGRLEAQAGFLMDAVQQTPDITLAELRQRLISERGETFAISTIHEFFRRHDVTFKKRRRMPVNRTVTSSRPAPRLGRHAASSRPEEARLH